MAILLLLYCFVLIGLYGEIIVPDCGCCETGTATSTSTSTSTSTFAGTGTHSCPPCGPSHDLSSVLSASVHVYSGPLGNKCTYLGFGGHCNLVGGQADWVRYTVRITWTNSIPFGPLAGSVGWAGSLSITSPGGCPASLEVALSCSGLRATVDLIGSCGSTLGMGVISPTSVVCRPPLFTYSRTVIDPITVTDSCTCSNTGTVTADMVITT